MNKDEAELLMEPDPFSDGEIVGITTFQDQVLVACKRSIWCFRYNHETDMWIRRLEYTV